MSRAELTPLIPGDPRMNRLPKGTCEFSRRDGRLWIDHADPRILISLELLDAIVLGEHAPEMTVRVLVNERNRGHGSWAGTVIRIDAANRTVLYRLTEYADFCLGYIAEWPD